MHYDNSPSFIWAITTNNNSRALETSRYEGFAGSVLIQHPIENKQGYESLEKAYRDACCGIEGFTDYCDLYFDRRMINTGEGYVPPLLGEQT